MIQKLMVPYRGLSREVWSLALISFINRAGYMVVPFLSLYLTRNLGFSLTQVGWIMGLYGLGSVGGVLMGGKLADKIGFHKVMYSSLFLTGIFFLLLQTITSFYMMALAVFLLTLVADTFRPAMWVALNAYSKPENRTRSVTLIRLAINLGFSMGPALGGFIIAGVGYTGLFWVDGLTCIIAALMIFWMLYQKAAQKTEEEIAGNTGQNPYTDRKFLLFWAGMFLTGFGFMQYFSTLPLYYNNVVGLNEKHIGWLLSLNGLLVFLTEMPIVHKLEKIKKNKINIIIVGSVLFALSFLVLNLSAWAGLVVIGMIFMSFGEILGFPFSNSYAMERAQKGNHGAYMGMYSMSFSVAFIIGPYVGMHLIDHFGYGFTWYVMGGVYLLAAVLFGWLKRMKD